MAPCLYYVVRICATMNASYYTINVVIYYMVLVLFNDRNSDII